MWAWLGSGAMEDLRNGSLANVELGHFSFKLLSNSRGSYSLVHSLTKVYKWQEPRMEELLGWAGKGL